MRLFAKICISVFAVFVLPHIYPAEAVLPPDILFSIGTQTSQIVALIGVMVLSALGALGMYIKYGLSVVRSRVGLMTIGITLCIWAIYYGFHTLQVSNPTMSGRHYESLRVVVIGTNPEEPFALEIDLNSRESASNDFEHYYFAELVHNQTASDAYIEFSNSDMHLRSYDFLTEFTRTPATDQSTRERVSFSVMMNDEKISVTTDELLAGDFITKNTPAYTKYASVGTATIEAYGKKFPGYIFVSPVYSDDYTTYIFTDDYDTLIGSAKQFLFWDTDGNFYLVDESKVQNPTPAYPAHFWTLHKDSATGATYKSFGGMIASDNPTLETESAWRLTSDSPARFAADITAGTKYTGGLHGMFITGTVQKYAGVRVPIMGTAYVHKL